MLHSATINTFDVFLAFIFALAALAGAISLFPKLRRELQNMAASIPGWLEAGDCDPEKMKLFEQSYRNLRTDIRGSKTRNEVEANRREIEEFYDAFVNLVPRYKLFTYMDNLNDACNKRIELLTPSRVN